MRIGDEHQRRGGALKEREFWRNEGMQKRETEKWMRSYRWLRHRGWDDSFLSITPSSGCLCYRLEEQSAVCCICSAVIRSFFDLFLCPAEENRQNKTKSCAERRNLNGWGDRCAHCIFTHGKGCRMFYELCRTARRTQTLLTSSSGVGSDWPELFFPCVRTEVTLGNVRWH